METRETVFSETLALRVLELKKQNAQLRRDLLRQRRRAERWHEAWLKLFRAHEREANRRYCAERRARARA